MKKCKFCNNKICNFNSSSNNNNLVEFYRCKIATVICSSKCNNYNHNYQKITVILTAVANFLHKECVQKVNLKQLFPVFLN